MIITIFNIILTAMITNPTSYAITKPRVFYEKYISQIGALTVSPLTVPEYS